MGQTIAASFATRRDADMAIEHLIQEHAVDPNAISVAAASEQNSAGMHREPPAWAQCHPMAF